MSENQLVDSVKAAKERVGEAFDTLVRDIEAEDTVEPGDVSGEPVKVVKLTAEYSDGSTVDFTPPPPDSDTADEVKDLTPQAEEAGEVEDAPKSDAAGSEAAIEGGAGNSEQIGQVESPGTAQGA